MPQVLNKRHGVPADAAYVGRPTPFGNPFSHLSGTRATHMVATRDEAVDRFEAWIHTQPALLEAARRELAGKDLVCWCAPQRCHADILLKIANPVSQVAMRVIVAGGREFTDRCVIATHVKQLIEEGWMPANATLVCGMARGADMTAHALWLETPGATIECFPADWNKHGRGAGHIRNAQMAATANRLIAFWDGQSRGTANMIQTMQRLGKPTHVVPY